MEKCYFEVGKTYVDEYRREFKVTEVRPHYPHKDTFDGEITECPDGQNNWWDIYTDKPHRPWQDEKFADKYEHFEQFSYRHDKLVAINKDPKHKDFICVVPGAHIICDSHEQDPETRDYVEYAVFGKDWCNYHNDNKLTPEEREWVHDAVKRMQDEM